MENDGYFGLCPVCHKTDGYINIGRSHWFLCEEHKTKWWIGANLFSSWKYETREEQRANYDRLGFGSFQAVEPFRPANAGAPGLVAVRIWTRTDSETEGLL